MPEPIVANKDTTEIQIPQNMHIESTGASNDSVATTDDGEEIFNPRKDAMEAIYASRNAVIERELGLATEMIKDNSDDKSESVANTQALGETQGGDTQTSPSSSPNTTAQQTTQTQAQTQQQDQQSSANTQAQTSSKHVLNVEGRSIEVSQDDLIRLAQQGMSANQRYQAAARMREEAAAMLQNGQTRQPQQVAQQPQPQAQTQTAHANEANLIYDVIDDQTAENLRQQLNYGSEEEQKKAIRQLGATVAAQIVGRLPKAPNPQELVNSVASKVLAETEFRTNLSTIATEFQDVFKDRPLAIAAADTVGQLRLQYAAQGIMKTDLDIYREACGQIRDRYITKTTQETQAPATPPATSVQAASNVIPMTEKLERKRTAPQPPTAASKVSNEGPVQKSVSPSSIVQQMRKSRGQSAY